jgi:hypothetical protein
MHFINGKMSEDLQVTEIAKSVKINTFISCTAFKKGVGCEYC